MKTTLLTLGTAILFTMASIATIGYAGTEHKHAGKKEGGHHGHGQDKHQEGHMSHMEAVRKKLKCELGDEYNQPVPAATKEELALGRKTFIESCVACHGESGKGDGPAAVGLERKPADFTDPEHSSYYSDRGRIHIIKKGIVDTPMPAWEGVLSEEEILSVHAYIRSLRSPAKKEKHGHGEQHTKSAHQH